MNSETPGKGGAWWTTYTHFPALLQPSGWALIAADSDYTVFDFTHPLRVNIEIQSSDFTAQAMDQIANQAAKIHFMLGGALHVPMVLRTPQGSGTGAAAQHSQNLEPWFASVPGLKVVVPSNPADAKGLLLASIDDPNPVIFL